MGLFGTSGIRAPFDNNLLYLAVEVGLAVGKVYDSVVVGSDTRTSSDTMKLAIISGLLAAGTRCEDAGVVPTPTLGFATRKFTAGVMITASHNPPEYNGIKLLNPDGSSFGAGQQKQIEAMVLGDYSDVVLWSEIKGSGIYDGAIEQHVARILQDFPSGLKLKVVLDCGCGAASVITPHLLKELGCEVVELNCQPSGFFPRGIEPTESNLGDLIQAVRKAGFLCERADLSAFTGDIMQWVRDRIYSAALVVADLTGANPNVYLEVGYAWGCGKPTVLLARDKPPSEFDARGHRCLVYKRIQDLETLLAQELQNLRQNTIHQ